MDPPIGFRISGLLVQTYLPASWFLTWQSHSRLTCRHDPVMHTDANQNQSGDSQDWLGVNQHFAHRFVRKLIGIFYLTRLLCQLVSTPTPIPYLRRTSIRRDPMGFLNPVYSPLILASNRCKVQGLFNKTLPLLLDRGDTCFLRLW